SLAPDANPDSALATRSISSTSMTWKIAEGQDELLQETNLPWVLDPEVRISKAERPFDSNLERYLSDKSRDKGLLAYRIA
ncbi:MAG: hypothetical protein ACR2NZ_08475, partial [Rubripirellula sp.]